MRSVFVLLLVAACDGSSGGAEPASATSPPPRAAPTSSATPPGDGGSADAGPHAASERLLRCAESRGAIESIADAVARLDTIVDKGGDGACFVATLPRPLAVVATLNMASAQPAGGRGAPRLFFMLPKIVLTAAPDGSGSKVLELGEWTGTTSTIKGEIALPVTSALAPDAPFQRVLAGDDRTVCAPCHGREEPHATIPHAFVSDALRPTSLVTLAELEELHRLCVISGAASSRCEFIHAVFDFGDVTQGAFSPVVATMN